PSSVDDGEGSTTFDERDREKREEEEEEAGNAFTARRAAFGEEGAGARSDDERDADGIGGAGAGGEEEEDDDDDDDADDIDLAEWEVSRAGKRAGDSRYVLQLRQPSSGSFLLLGATDPLVYEEWVEDVLYVQQRTMALEWTRRFRAKMSKDPSPPLSAFGLLPDRDWNREWEAACSLTGGGRGGRDPRVTIALGQQFRAFAGAVAGAALRANLPKSELELERSSSHARRGRQEAWCTRLCIRNSTSKCGFALCSNVSRTHAGDVQRTLSQATPDECWTFLMGNVAFVLAPRGSGSGYKTHKRLGAELKGAQVLSRRAVERRVLSGVAGGGAGPERVNALAPLSCVVDLYGVRAAAVALPAFRPRTDGKPKVRALPKLLGYARFFSRGGRYARFFVGHAQPPLIVEAVSGLLECDRESVTRTGMLSHGLEIFFKQEGEGGGGFGRGGSRHLQKGGSVAVMNERASRLAGKRVVGDAVVVLVGGGVEHGAAGSGDVDGDALDHRDKTSPRLPHVSIETERWAEEGRNRTNLRLPDLSKIAGGGSALILETLLPRLAGRLANDALVGGSGNPPLFLFDGGHLCAALHGAGVNLRYLPTRRVRAQYWEHEGTRQLIAAEILARAAKHVLACRLQLPNVTSGSRDETASPSPTSYSDERVRAVARLLLNAVLFRTYSSEETRERAATNGSASSPPTWRESWQSPRLPNGRDGTGGRLARSGESLAHAASVESLIGDSSPVPPPLTRLTAHRYASSGGMSMDRGSAAGESTVWDSCRESEFSATPLSLAGEAALFWEVESPLWLILGPFGSVGGMEFEGGEADSRMHLCRGLSGLHLLPALTRNLGILLTARAMRKLQENGVVNRIKSSHVDHRTGGPAAIGSARFKGLGEEAAAVKRRLRDKCRRRWAATRGNGGAPRHGGGRAGAGIGWTGTSVEERAEYAAVAEDVLGPFMDGRGRGEALAYARREIAEAHLAVAVSDWTEGNPRSAKTEAERALRALLKGKLGGYVDGDEEEAARKDGRAGEGEGVPVPLGLCVAAAGMFLTACCVNGGGMALRPLLTLHPPKPVGTRPTVLSSNMDNKPTKSLHKKKKVNFPGRSSTLRTPSGPRDASLWGSHPLVPAIACLLVGKTSGDLSSEEAGTSLLTSSKRPGGRREKGGVVDWMANQLKTGPFPTNSLISLLGRKSAGRRSDVDGGGAAAETQLDPADAIARLVSLLLKGEGGLVERWFKMSSACSGGAAELLAPPDTFLWLLEASGGSGRGDLSAPGEEEKSGAPWSRIASDVLPKQVVATIDAFRGHVRAVPGRLYVDGNV
ncbi:unnamed protein product, partial [Scytosiphon promiscuus]